MKYLNQSFRNFFYNKSGEIFQENDYFLSLINSNTYKISVIDLKNNTVRYETMSSYLGKYQMSVTELSELDIRKVLL